MKRLTILALTFGCLTAYAQNNIQCPATITCSNQKTINCNVNKKQWETNAESYAKYENITFKLNSVGWNENNKKSIIMCRYNSSVNQVSLYHKNGWYPQVDSGWEGSELSKGMYQGRCDPLINPCYISTKVF